MGLFIIIIEVIIVTTNIICSINLQYLLCAYYVQSTLEIQQNICDLCPNIFLKTELY